MSYEVLARKWRPQTFSEVVGQEHVVTTLKNAIESQRLAHTYLFVGPRGTGKTSIARIFAKALNCHDKSSVEPCCKCDSCREIAAGNSLDVIEIDGASNNGVEQIRDLRDTVIYAPVSGEYKIYIIDEVHMLSTSAFNALLKTLEEPPAHVKFFFATTEPEKVLPTIISRCQRYDVRRIETPKIVERLRLIANTDNIEIDDDALFAIARGADGGLRDAESALDQIISFRGNKIIEDDILSVFGLVSRIKLEQLSNHILDGNVKDVLNDISDMDAAGKDLGKLLYELMGHLRNILVFLNTGSVGIQGEYTPEQINVLKEQSCKTDTGKLLGILDILIECYDRMRFALSKRTLIETALVRAARMSSSVSLDRILLELNALKEKVAKGDVILDVSTKEANAVSLEENSTHTLPVDQERNTLNEPQDVYKPNTANNADAVEEKKEPREEEPSVDKDKELSNLRDNWEKIIKNIGEIVIPCKKLLKNSHPVSVDGDVVTIGFESEFADNLDKFKNKRNSSVVEHILSRILKRKITCKYMILEGKIAADYIDDKNPAIEDKKKARHDLVNHPVVQEALELFDGNILEIRD